MSPSIATSSRVASPEAFASLVLDHLPDGVVVLGPHGELLQMNRSARALLDLLLPDGGELVDALGLRALLEGNHRRGTFHSIHYVEGPPRLALRVELFPFEGWSSWLLTLRDVTLERDLLQTVRNRESELDGFYRLSRLLAGVHDAPTLYRLATQHVVEALEVTTCRIVLEKNGGFVCGGASARRGLPVPESGRVESPEASALYRSLLHGEGRLLHPHDPGVPDELGRGYAYLYFEPLRGPDGPIGGLLLAEARSEQRQPFTRDKREHLQSMSSLIASAAHSLRVEVEARDSWLDGVLALARAMDARDAAVGLHGQVLAEAATTLARHLGLPPEEQEIVHWGALLHDIGKIGVPDRILRKPGPLTPEEWEIMRRHPLIGERILLAGPSLRRVVPIVRHHHERWDGRGYPDGLAGEAIPLHARIVAVVDAWCAMNESRPHRPPYPEHEIRQILFRGAGTQFDPQVLHAFLELLDSGRVRYPGRGAG